MQLREITSLVSPIGVSRIIFSRILVAVFCAAFLLGGAVRGQAATKWAMLIGVDRYKNANITELRYAVADAKAIQSSLIGKAQFRRLNVQLMTSDYNEFGPDYPSRVNVLQRLDELAEQVKPEDTFLFYFSGHGFKIGGESFLATVDADPASAESLKATSIFVPVLTEKMRAIKARKVIFIFDACRNDPQAAKGGDGGQLSPELAKDLKLVVESTADHQVESSAVLYACSPGERAYEWAEKGHGVFTTYLIQGLNGDPEATERDGSISINGLMDYVQTKVSRWAAGRPGGLQQTPIVEAKGAGKIILVEKGAGAPGPGPVSANCTPDRDKAAISLSSTPQGARVFVDGAEVTNQVTPCCVMLDMFERRRTVRVELRMPDYETAVMLVPLEQGERTDKAVTLSKKAFPPVPCVKRFVVQVGSEVPVVLDEPLNAGKKRPGDSFTGYVPQNMLGPDGEILIAQGAIVSGTVRSAREISLDSTVADDGTPVRLQMKPLPLKDPLLKNGRFEIPTTATLTALVKVPCSVKVNSFCKVGEPNLTVAVKWEPPPPPPPVTICRLFVDSVPPGAEVLLNGSLMPGKVTPCFFEVPLASDKPKEKIKTKGPLKQKVTVKVRLNGIESEVRDIELTGGTEVKPEAFLLARDPKICRVNISSTPTGADVFVDGERMQNLKTTCAFDLPADKEKVLISVQMEGYEAEEREVELKGGQELPLISFVMRKVCEAQWDRAKARLHQQMQNQETNASNQMVTLRASVSRTVSTQTQGAYKEMQDIGAELRQGPPANLVGKPEAWFNAFRARIATLQKNAPTRLAAAEESYKGAIQKERDRLDVIAQRSREELRAADCLAEPGKSEEKNRESAGIDQREKAISTLLDKEAIECARLLDEGRKMLAERLGREAEQLLQEITEKEKVREGDDYEAWLLAQRAELNRVLGEQETANEKLLQEAATAQAARLQKGRTDVEERLKAAPVGDKVALRAFYKQEEEALTARFAEEEKTFAAQTQKAKDGLAAWSTQNRAARKAAWDKGPGGVPMAPKDRSDFEKIMAAREEKLAAAQQTQAQNLSAAIGKEKQALLSLLHERKIVDIENSSPVVYSTLWLQKTLTGHAAAANAVAFSPDGQFIASGSTDKTAKLWNANTGALLRSFEPHYAAVNAVAFSPDGKTLATGCWDNIVRLWPVAAPASTATPPVARLFKAHTAPVTSLAFSPDGRLLATGSEDRTILLWDVKSGKVEKTLSGHEDRVRAVAFSTDGKTLVSCSNDKTVKFWNVETGEVKQDLAAFSYTVGSMSLAPDNASVACASGAVVWLFEAEKGARLGSVSLNNGPMVSSVTFSPDGLVIACGGDDNSVSVWGVLSGRQKGLTLTNHKGRVGALAFSPDGLNLASASADNTVKLWRATPSATAATATTAVLPDKEEKDGATTTTTTERSPAKEPVKEPVKTPVKDPKKTP